MSSTFKNALKFILFIGFGVAILALVFKGQNAAYVEQCRLDGISDAQCSLADKLWQDFSTVRPGWVVLVVLSFTMSNLFRALRWQMLLAPLGHQTRLANSFLTILLSYFANLGLPRMGEVVRAGTMARYERIPLEKVMGTLVIDRLMDFICLGVVVGLAFVLEGEQLLQFMNGRPGSGGGLWSNPIVWGFLAVCVAGAALLYLLRERWLHLPIVEKVLSLLQGFRDGLRSVFRLSNPWLFLFYSAGIWLMFYVQCYFSLHSFPITSSLGAQAALMVFVFGTLGFVIPSPGGMGTYHALAIAGLGLYGISGSDAFSYANISFFTIQIFYNIIGGLTALLLLPLINKKVAQWAASDKSSIKYNPANKP